MKISRLFILFSFFLASTYVARGQNIMYNKSDSLIYETYIKQFAEQKDIPFNELIVNTAKYFLGKPYVASTLEQAGNEKLVINLHEFDCTTFIESCITLSRVIKSGDFSFENYCKLLTSIRYRNGIINGYTSRLHYTSDAIYDNERRGLFKNITQEIGGRKVTKIVNFMSTHPLLYKQLKNNPENVKLLSEIEKSINKRDCFTILPTIAMGKNEIKIFNGDIIAFATSVSGLDYSHIGIAYWQGDILNFIHASSKSKQVVIETKTLLQYSEGSKTCTGISVIRLNKDK